MIDDDISTTHKFDPSGVGASTSAGASASQKTSGGPAGQSSPKTTGGTSANPGAQQGASGHSTPPPPPPPQPPRIICPTIFFGRTPPPRRWVVNHWVPYEVVTGLYGDGGVGKSLLAQQLQTGCALGSSWLGLAVEEIASLGIYCEDDENELWRRQHSINVAYCADYDMLSAMHWMPRLGEDNLMMTFDLNGVGKETPFHKYVLEAALDLKTKLVIIDTASDTFGGNENDRSQVRQYLQRGLGQIALKIGGSVICCAHPSRAGLASGEGDSGSTGWSNAFRSRTSLRHDDPGQIDPNARVLERKKANYASRDDSLKLRWRDGVIVPENWQAAPGMTPMGKVDVKVVFLDLIREMNKQGPSLQRPHPSGRRHRYGFKDRRWS